MLFNSFEFLVFLPIVFIVEFFAYISFFLQLVAGPIERATNLLRLIVISLYQKAFKMLCLFLAINRITHLFRYLWRKVAPNERLLNLISNLVF